MMGKWFTVNILFAALALLLPACEPRQPQSVFTLLSPGRTGIHFQNTITENDSVNLIMNEYLYNGGGVAIGDINNDGLADLYFSGNQVPGRLYLNKGNLRFEDITEKAGVTPRGWATGVNLVDLNADGYLDLYVCMSGVHASGQRANQLYLNNKDLTFTESAEAYGLADTGYATQAAFLDYDRDGDLDLYLLNHKLAQENPNFIRPRQVNGENGNTDKLYRNEGPQRGHPVFRDVSREAGITIEGYGLGVGVSDLNGDGWPDIYVSNDYLSPDILYVNNRDGTFTDRIDSVVQHQSYSAMGNDLADFNNDALPDIITVDMMPEENYRRKTMHSVMNYDRHRMELASGYPPQFARNMLQVNQGPGRNGLPRFSETGYLSGVNATDWSWSPLFADFDNDGFKDLHITNGFVRDLTNGDFVMYRMQQYGNKLVSDREYVKTLAQGLAAYPGVKKVNYLYRNNGDLTFRNATRDWGVEESSYSNGAAYADLDNDGDLEIVVNNLNGNAFLYENNLVSPGKARPGGSHFLKVRLAGAGLNTGGLGAKVTLRSGPQVQVLEQYPCRGFLSSVDPVLHFGLGKVARVDSLLVQWNDGRSQVLRGVGADQTLVLQQKDAGPATGDAGGPSWVPAGPATGVSLEEVTDRYRIHFRHREENYVDFKSSPLLPQLYSQLGPGLAVGDLNGDGREDFYVGGSFKQPGALFFQQPDGTFRSRPVTGGTKYEEDMGSLLFDADGDHDLDLYVVSGSSEFADGSPYFADKLYTNDGEGNLTLARAALPATTSSGSCVTAADYDGDGDLDLFRGGRLVPGRYPFPARSYLLRNDGGRFTDVTAEVAPGLQTAGLVSAALWSDYDNDGATDLVLAGEWMPVAFFKNENGKRFTPAAAATAPAGWWNSLAGGDFDNDGDTDYVVGNLGANSLYRVGPERPVSIHAADFDGSTTTDAVLGHYIVGEDGQYHAYPAHSRDVLTPAMPSIRNVFNSFADYGRADLRTFLARLPVPPQLSLSATELRTTYLENTGGGRFKAKPLPLQAQLAPVFGLVCADLNEDGNLDVLLTGNSFSTEVMAGRYDAGYGLCLRGDGKGNFTPDPSSGFVVAGDAKGLARLVGPGGKTLFLAARNDNTMLAFESKTKHGENQVIVPRDGDTGADVRLANGKTRREEFYFGSGYLSHSSRTLVFNEAILSVRIHNNREPAREVTTRSHTQKQLAHLPGRAR